MLKFGEPSVASLVDEACRERVADWFGLLDDALAAAGGLDGTGAPASGPARTALTIQPRL